MTAGPATTDAIRDEQTLALARRFVNALSTYEHSGDLFAPDLLFDVNVPQWRFQLQGQDALFGWLRSHSLHGYRLNVLRAVATSSGFVVEYDGDYDEGAETPYFRNMVLCEVRDGRIAEAVYYCTGNWDAETRERQRAEAPMIRPDA